MMSQSGQRVGVVAESRAGETRVAATAVTVAQLRDLGYQVVVESGAGLGASLDDEAYRQAGADIGSRTQVWGADVVLAVNAPSAEEIALLADGSTLISLLG